MKKQFEFSRVLKSSPEAAWAVLSQLGAVDEWAPMITECRLEGRGSGAKRHCVTADGTALVEHILEVDESQKAVRYAVTEGLPVERYEGVFSIRDERTPVAHWVIEAEGSEEAVRQVEAMLGQVAAAMLEGLDARAGRASPPKDAARFA